MNLPITIGMRNIAHGTGANGMAFYEYIDANGIGVRRDVRRQSFHQPFVDTWFFDWLPDREFKSYAELHAKVALIGEEIFEAEKAKYPFIRSTRDEDDDDFIGWKCRMCPLGDRDVGVVDVLIAHNWRPCDDQLTGLCEAHRWMLEDPAALVAALKAEVEERRRRREAKEG